MELRDCCARVLYKNAKSVLGSMMKTNPQQWPRCHAIASLTQLHRILTQKSELEGTHNDPQVQILSEWPIWRLNPQLNVISTML